MLWSFRKGICKGPCQQNKEIISSRGTQASLAFVKSNVSPHHHQECFSPALSWSLSKSKLHWTKLKSQEKTLCKASMKAIEEARIQSEFNSTETKGGRVFECWGELVKRTQDIRRQLDRWHGSCTQLVFNVQMLPLQSGHPCLLVSPCWH